jgi:MFS family permease
MMLFLRVLQGIAVAAPGVLSKAILTDVFLGERLGKLSTSMTMTWAIGPIIAPVIGGYLEVYFGWQSSFYFFAIYGALILCLALIVLEETNVHRISLNFPNLMKIYREACTHKVFFGALVSISIAYSLIVVFNVAGPFIIQTVLGYSPIDYGHFALFMGLGFFIGSLANRFLLRHLPVSTILPLGIYYGTTVACLMLIVSALFGMHLITLIASTFCLLIASGSIFPNCMAKCLSLFPKTAGTATAIMGSFFIIGTAIITSMASLLETKTLIPISLCYVLLMGISLTTYLLMLRAKPPPPVTR